MKSILEMAAEGDLAGIINKDRRNKDLNKMDENGNTSLIISVYHGHYDAVKLLIQTGRVNINKTNFDGKGALYYAVKKNNLDMVELLLDNGANPYEAEKPDANPVFLACANDYDDILQLFLNAGVNPSFSLNSGVANLHLCVCNNSIRCVKILLDADACLTSKDANGCTPLQLSIERENDEVSALIRENQKKKLFEEAEKYDTSYLMELISAGTNVDCVNEKGETPLFKAVYTGRPVSIEILIDAGANINHRDNYGYTPLHEAVRGNNFNCVKVLVERGADVCAKLPNNGSTAFEMAKNNNYEDISNFLKTNTPNDLILKAVEAGNEEVIKNYGGFPSIHIAFIKRNMPDAQIPPSVLKIMDEKLFMCFEYCHDRILASELAKKAEIKNSNMDYVFVRTIKEPAKNSTTPYNESNLDLEFRKISRTPGKPTKTKKISFKDGCQNRSTSMLGNNIKLFGRIGYAFKNPEVKDILTVAEYDHGSGRGKKEFVSKALHSNIPQNIDIPIQLALLKRIINEGKVTNCNEVNINITSKTSNNILYFFFESTNDIFSSERKYSRDLKILFSQYFVSKYEVLNGKKLPICEYTEHKGMAQLPELQSKDIIKLLNNVMKSDAFVLNYEYQDFWKEMSKYVKEDISLKKAVGSYFEKYLQDTIPPKFPYFLGLGKFPEQRKPTLNWKKELTFQPNNKFTLFSNTTLKANAVKNVLSILKSIDFDKDKINSLHEIWAKANVSADFGRVPSLLKFKFTQPLQ